MVSILGHHLGYSLGLPAWASTTWAKGPALLVLIFCGDQPPQRDMWPGSCLDGYLALCPFIFTLSFSKRYGFTLLFLLFASNSTYAHYFWQMANAYSTLPENPECFQLYLNCQGPALYGVSLLHTLHWSSLLEISHSLYGTKAKSISDEIISLGQSKQLISSLLNHCVNKMSWPVTWNECHFGNVTFHLLLPKWMQSC